MNNEMHAIPKAELDRQLEYINSIYALALGLKYHIVTLGCQMNVRDSETLSGMLTEMGFSETETREEADIIVYNTCCVRENAENKALGNVIWLKELKKTNPNLIICVGGCMMQEAGVAETLINQYPFIDIIFGTHNAHKFPEYLFKRLDARMRTSEVFESPVGLPEGLPEKRRDKHFAFVNIMYGCNNFCSYCIVPYVRGRERSRNMGDILTECERLRDSGVKEITLLGQNVNSYMGGGDNFAELLAKVDALGIERIRFMTSHPKDLSDSLISAFGSLKHLCPSLHLPVQAGNDEILRLMNRRYTSEKYLSLIQKLRAACPDIGLTTDIIVGFPGETEAQFEDTLALVKEARYDAAYTFIYSPRVGTKAAEMPDPFTIEEKTERIQRLIALQQSISSEVLLSRVGRTEEVLVEGASTRDDMSVGGRTPRGHMVNFRGDNALKGTLVRVNITSAGKNTLRGEAVKG